MSSDSFLLKVFYAITASTFFVATMDTPVPAQSAITTSPIFTGAGIVTLRISSFEYFALRYIMFRLNGYHLNGSAIHVNGRGYDPGGA